MTLNAGLRLLGWSPHFKLELCAPISLLDSTKYDEGVSTCAFVSLQNQPQTANLPEWEAAHMAEVSISSLDFPQS